MNIDWEKWGNNEYMDDSTLEYKVKLYKSLFSLYNIKSKNMSLLEINTDVVQKTIEMG